MENNKANLKKAALDYHRAEPKGKIQMEPSKPYATQWDLSLAYSPGVAEPCLEIDKNIICPRVSTIGRYLLITSGKQVCWTVL